MTNYAIEVENLSKTYKVGFLQRQERQALKPLTLSIHRGEVFGYLGPNGAGKTTTLKILMGLMYPTTGAARLNGISVEDPACKQDIGYLPEQPYFYDHLTAPELLRYFGRLSGLTNTALSERIPRTLQRVGLGEVNPKLQLRKFSKGMLQRVGLGQAILHDPSLVILDEPMSGLDPVGRREVRDLIHQLKQEGKTIFFSTHVLSDAESLCDRVAVLNKGELRGVGVVRELLTREGSSVELLAHGSASQTRLEALGASCSCTGEILRAVVPPEKVDAALDAIRLSGSKLLSLNPLQRSLEEYFLERLRTPDATAASVPTGARR